MPSLSQESRGNDRMKLDESHRSSRDRARIERAEGESALRPNVLAGLEKPEGVPRSYEDHIRLMGDMMILRSRPMSPGFPPLCWPTPAQPQLPPDWRERGSTYSLSHHQNDRAKLEKISKINTFHVQQLSYILQKMKSTAEGDGSLLDNTMIVYGSGISDGNKHNNENLPILLAGRGGGLVRPSRHIQYSEDTPLNNLFVTMLNQMGATTDTFNDSTGHLPFLS